MHVLRRAGGRLGPLRAAVAIIMVALLPQCAGPPAGLLRTVEASAATDTVDLLAATIREPSDEPGTLFGGLRGTAVAYVNVMVSLPERRQVGAIQWPSQLPGDPEVDFVATRVSPLDAPGVHAWFASRHGRQRSVFVYVHGFNTRFDVAVFRMAQLVHDARIEAAPVLFSWPSRGRLLDFKLDHQNATYARSDLARLLQTAAASPNVEQITILAHSMGSWLAMEALRQIALEDGTISPKIDNLILASPELDVGLFRRQLREMGDARPDVVLFVSRNDRALRLSRVISGGATRLGAIDVTDPAQQQELAEIEGLTIVDLTAVRGGDLLSHSLYAESPEVVRLIGSRLIEGQILTDAEGPQAGPIGSVLGAVAVVPIIVLDSATPSR